MATTTNLSLIAVRNGTGGYTSWSAISGNSYNRFYTGTYPNGESKIYRRSRVDFSTNNVIISSSKKLVVKVTIAESDYYCNKLMARLSATDIAPNNYYETTNKVVSDAMNNATIGQPSPAYDMNGSQISGIVKEGTSIQFIFNLADTAIQANKTYYIYFGQEDVRSGTYLTTATVNTITLTHETYTKCGAPSSVSLSRYVVPNGNFTVSWGAGTAGNANGISGYRISCGSIKPGSSRVYSQSFTVGKDARSLKISASKITNGSVRGNYIYCKVQTLGSVSGYDSVEKESSAGVTINSLPNQPTEVSVSKSVLPSTGGSITLKATPGTDTSNDNTPRTVYYSTSQTGAKTIMTNGSATVSVKNNTTFYFWTYDSLEFNTSPVTKTVKINTKPICGISLTGSTVQTQTSVPQDCSYILSPTIIATKENSTLSNTNTYESFYKIYKDLTKSPVAEGSYGKDQQFSITDVRSAFSISPPYYYSFGAKVNDGIEDSNVVWTNEYYVTGAPAIKNIYNTSAGNNAEGMGQYSGQDSFYFSNQLCFDFVYDAGYDGKSFSLNNSSKSAQVNKLANEQTLRAFFNDCGITAFGEYILSGYFLNKSECSCQASRAMYRIKPFEIKNLSVTNCKPHTNKNIYASIASNGLTNPKEFGINADNIVSINSFTGVLAYQNNTLTQDLEIDSEGKDTFIFKSFEYDHNSFGVNQNETYRMTFTLSLTNVFGETYFGSYPVVVDYKEVPKINSIDIRLPNEGTNEIKEGQEVTITISYENCYNSGQTLSFNTPYGIERVYLTKTEERKTFGFKVPKTQTTEEINKLDFVITNGANTSASLEVVTSIKFLKHTAPSVVLTRTDYSESNSGNADKGNLIIYFSPSDWGLDPALHTENTTIKLSLYRSKTENADKVELGTKSFVYNADLTSCLFENISVGEKVDWQAQDIYLEVVVTSTTYITTEYTQAATNTILVYNLTPTVAYRKNQLGVNTKDPTEHADAAIVIGGAGNRDKIFYETNQDRPYCKVVNFQFNGGSWTSGLDDDDIGVVIGELTPAENLFF